jgi:hypothetical protein
VRQVKTFFKLTLMTFNGGLAGAVLIIPGQSQALWESQSACIAIPDCGDVRIVNRKEIAMKSIILALTALTVSVGSAAYAAAPSPASPSQILPTPAAPAQPTLQTYNSQSTTMFRPTNAFNDSAVPGATGSTIVPGDASTVAGDRMATEMQQTGTYGP